MLRLRLGSHAKKIYKESGIVYLPDFIIYDLDEIEYQNFWSGIHNHPRSQLYTDGLQVYKVNWLFSLFQRFKGWLGFENHCQTNKVEMTLAKIAYYGYLRNFHSPAFQKMDPPIISERFKFLINLKRNNQQSADIQQLLISYYITHSDHFFRHIEQPYPFGQIFVNEHLYHLIPSIDPQDSSIISNAIWGLHNQYQVEHQLDYFKSSTFAEYFAEYLVEQNNFKQAIEWSEDIIYKFKELFINYFLSQKTHNSQASVKAIALIEALHNSPKMEAQLKAIDYLKKHFNIAEQLEYLKTYPELRNKLANSYLNDAKTEKNRFTLTKFLFGNQLISLLAHAVRLNPNILAQDSSMEDIILKEEWTTYLFNEAINEQRYTEAKALYEAHSNFKFDKKNLMILRDYYLEELDTKKQIIRTELEKANVELANQTALDRIAIAEQIANITPQDNSLMTVTMDYASTLLATDKIMHPEVKDADLDMLDKAQSTINKYFLLNKSTNLRQLLSDILLRKIDCLIEKIRVPITFNDNWVLRAEFVTSNQSVITRLQTALNHFTSINEKNKNNEFRPILAKIHYLKGDVISFFIRNNQEALPHYKKATDLLPENPYYRFRYLELSQNERRHDAWETIENLGHLHGTKYNDWMEERWNEQQYMSEGFSIHYISAEKQGLLSSLIRRFK